MKKKNRDINIFSMSALDLFASAMGAFLLIAVIALPYYLKVDKNLIEQVKKLEEDIQSSKAANKQLQEQNQQMKKQNEALQKANSDLKGQLSKTFCVINMQWKSTKVQDVDLHVVDPSGNEYSFEVKSYPNKSAYFVFDSKGVKKGAEVWVEKELQAGDYKIYYTYYSGTGPVNIKGSIYTKSFTEDLPTKTMRVPNPKHKELIATIHVDSNQNATLEVH